MTPEDRIRKWKEMEPVPKWTGPPPDWDLHTASQNGKYEAPPIRSICLTDVIVEKPDWLWENRIARGSLVIVEGIEGVGKSTMLCAIAAAVTCGQGLPDMHFNGPETVLWLAAEESLGMTLKPRLMAAGADLSRVYAIDQPFSFDDEGISVLMREIDEHRPAMGIIDPIFAFTKGDPSKGFDARQLTNRLKKIAEAFKCVIVLVRHIGKSKGLGDPRAAGLYSIEWRAAARSVLLAGCDPDDESKCALAQTKNNIGPKAEPIGYRIDSDANSPSGATFRWTGVSDLTAKRILQAPGNEEEQSEKKDAEGFLREMLQNGERLANEVAGEARRCSISEATLRRAKSNLKVVSRLEGYGRKGTWYWSLPENWDLPESLISSQACNRDAQASKNERLLPNVESIDTSADEGQRDAQMSITVGDSSPQTCSNERLFDENPDNSNDFKELLRDAQISEDERLSLTDETPKSDYTDQDITPKDWKSPF